MNAWIIVSYVVIALVVMRVVFVKLYNEGDSEAADFALIAGLFWPASLIWYLCKFLFLATIFRPPQ